MTRRDGHLACCDINTLVTSAVELAELSLRENDVTLHLELTPQRLSVEVDPVQLEQVLLNLIRNGVEAMAAAESARRELTVRTEPGDGGVRVSVSDTGPGIAEQVAADVFDPLFTTKRAGLGMGLSISRSIIESCRGRIGVAPPVPGHGATFWFSLPLANG
jgi:signal transduction histidine kinase